MSGSNTNRQKMRPYDGREDLATTGVPILKSFRIDAGALTKNTEGGAKLFKKGDLILGFRCKVTEAFASAGAPNWQFGFIGTQMVSDIMVKGTLVENYVFGPNCDGTEYAGPLALNADDQFGVDESADVAPTAGKVDVDVLYIPAGEALGSNYQEFVLS